MEDRSGIHSAIAACRHSNQRVEYDIHPLPDPARGDLRGCPLGAPRAGLPDVRQRLGNLSLEIAVISPDESAAFIAQQTSFWREVVRTGKITTD